MRELWMFFGKFSVLSPERVSNVGLLRSQMLDFYDGLDSNNKIRWHRRKINYQYFFIMFLRRPCTM